RISPRGFRNERTIGSKDLSFERSEIKKTCIGVLPLNGDPFGEGGVTVWGGGVFFSGKHQKSKQ
ncbi:MAG: hypothetical protein D6765_00115, partial [Bacteroidetes bacterium]